MNYKTARAFSCSEFIEKKSRFIGYIQPVQTVDAALLFIQEITKKHWDATHNVYAYILREPAIKRCSDDGEPQGTAGVPVLDVLEKEGLTNVCVVATRYFGGIMLGAGGLVRAYTHTAKIAVDAADIIQMIECEKMVIKIDYSIYGKVMHILPNFQIFVENTLFEEIVKISCLMPKLHQKDFFKALQEISNGTVMPEIEGTVYHSY